MPKFSNAAPRLPSSPVATLPPDPLAPARTHEGGEAFLRTPEGELFVLAATNMVGEDTFYESAADRDARFVALVHEVTRRNPAFIAGGTDEHPTGLARYLRSDLLMRSASVVMACEYVKAGGANGRRVVDAVCQRPDEPAEVLGYWFATHGRSVPWPVKRGLADAVRRLYHEGAAIRYDGVSRSIRMGDVIELVHPTPKDARQEALFRYLLDDRHHGDAEARFPLSALVADQYLRRLPEDKRRWQIRTDVEHWDGPNEPTAWDVCGWGWERLAGWLPGGMDAEAWGWVIPHMGVLALIRNLRNFDEAGISAEARDLVKAKLRDPAEVERSRVFPYQAWAAYREAPSDYWREVLGDALDAVTRNVPALPGTLVAIDTSSSMMATVSNRSKMARVEVAAVMAAVTAASSGVDVVIFGQTNAPLNRRPGESVLRHVERIVASVGSVGHSTYGHTAIRDHYHAALHRRAFLFTDDQQHDSGRVSLDHVRTLYTVNFAGYRPSSLPSGTGGRHTLAGFSDATFRLIPILEAGRDARWPF